MGKLIGLAATAAAFLFIAYMIVSAEEVMKVCQTKYSYSTCVTMTQ